MSAVLLFHSPLQLAITGARTCKNSFPGDTIEDKLGPRDLELLLRLIRLGHESVLEHVNYTFDVVMSRACLQEVVRTRHASYSVQSTRYTLHKMSIDDVDSSIYKTGDKTIDAVNSVTLKAVLGMHGKNDILKYSVPEAMLTRAILTLNLRSLRHVVKTRTGRDVLEEYRKLVLDMVATLPESHRLFVEDCIYHEAVS